MGANMDLGLIFQWVGYIYVILQGLRGVLAILKSVLVMIPGEQFEGVLDKIDGYVSIIENFLGKFIPKPTKRE